MSPDIISCASNISKPNNLKLTVLSYKWIHLSNLNNSVHSLQSNKICQAKQYRLFSHTHTLSFAVSWVVTLPSTLVKPQGKLTEQDITQLTLENDSETYSSEDIKSDTRSDSDSDTDDMNNTNCTQQTTNTHCQLSVPAVHRFTGGPRHPDTPCY